MQICRRAFHVKRVINTSRAERRRGRGVPSLATSTGGSDAGSRTDHPGPRFAWNPRCSYPRAQGGIRVVRRHNTRFPAGETGRKVPPKGSVEDVFVVEPSAAVDLGLQIRCSHRPSMHHHWSIRLLTVGAQRLPARVLARDNAAMERGTSAIHDAPATMAFGGARTAPWFGARAGIWRVIRTTCELMPESKDHGVRTDAVVPLIQSGLEHLFSRCASA